MKKTIVIFAIMLIVSISYVIAIEARGTLYSINTHLGAGGQQAILSGRETTNGLGQYYIGTSQGNDYNLSVGLYYIGVPATTAVQELPVIIQAIVALIEDFGMEWILINWT